MSNPTTAHLAQACIWVKDLDRSLALYRDLLGMPVVRIVHGDEHGRTYAALGAPESILEIFQRTPAELDTTEKLPVAYGLHHIAVWIEDMDATEKRLTAAGFPYTKPVRRRVDWLGDVLNVSWIEDPDGVKIELLEHLGRR